MEIGNIYADIAGDYRYSVILSVHVVGDDESGRCVEWRLRHRGAVGGMDGPGGSYDAGTEVVERVNFPISGAKLAKITRTICNQDHIIAGYGKPNKNFRWHTGTKGISAAKADAALERWKMPKPV